MAKKPAITTIASGYYSRQALNSNFENLQAGFDNTLSLDGSTPNAMGADLDMNSNDILNAQTVNAEALRLDGVLVSSSSLAASGATLFSTDHTGDGTTVAYSTTYQAFIKDNTQVYIDGVYQNKAGYSISGTTLTFSEAPPLNAAIEIVVARSLDVAGTDAANVGYTQGGTSSTSRTVEAKLQESVSVKDFGAVGDGVTDDTAAIQAAFAESFSFIPEGTYKLNSAVSALNTPYKVVGSGWRRENTVAAVAVGSVFKSDIGVNNFLTFAPDPNDGTNATDVAGLKIEDIAIAHEGTGHALKIDHIINNVVDHVSISGGGIGLELNGFGFFSEIRNCQIINWTHTGVKILGSGSQHEIRNCQIGSSGDGTDVRYGVRTQCEGTVVQGGQVNANRTDNTGVGVWFDNPNASGINNFSRGTVSNVLCETDIGVKIGTAGNSRWDNVVVEEARADMGLFAGPIIQFTNTTGSKLLMPQIDRVASGTTAKWDGAEAINCGVILDASLSSAVFDVNASAVDPYVHFIGTMTQTARDAIHADANLRVVVDNVSASSGGVYLGECTRINSVWDKGSFSLDDDTATNFELPTRAGILYITSTSGADNQNRNVILFFNIDQGISTVSAGSDVVVNLTDGTLSGTTGADNKITVRLDKTNDLLYVENRIGSSIGFVYQVDQRGPK